MFPSPTSSLRMKMMLGLVLSLDAAGFGSSAAAALDINPRDNPREMSVRFTCSFRRCDLRTINDDQRDGEQREFMAAADRGIPPGHQRRQLPVGYPKSVARVAALNAWRIAAATT